MAKHRKRRQRSAVLAAGAAAGISSVLAFGHATNATAAIIPTHDALIGVGGWRNPTSDRIPDKFQGALREPGYVGVQYPAQLPVDPSVTEGVPALRSEVDKLPGSTILIVGYSEGSLVAEQYKRSLDPTDPATPNVKFLFIAAPFVPNGGIYARFPGLRIPGFTSTGAAAPSPFDETFVTLEYDLIGDFPAYANPLSLANAVAGLVYVHGDQGPDNVDLETAPKAVLTVHSDEGGTDTYVLVRAEHLPLLQPVRDVSAALRLTSLTEPVLGAVEPTLRLGVDMGYTDRDYQNADKPTRFSLITPPERIVETVRALPDAIKEGADNLRGGSAGGSGGGSAGGATSPAATSELSEKPRLDLRRAPATRPATRALNKVRTQVRESIKAVVDKTVNKTVNKTGVNKGVATKSHKADAPAKSDAPSEKASENDGV